MITFKEYGIDYDCFDLDYYNDNIKDQEDTFRYNPRRDPSIYHHTVECIICNKLLVTCTCKNCDRYTKKIICKKCTNDNNVILNIEHLDILLWV